MLRRALIALAALAMFTLPAAAFEIDQMTDNERAIFRAEIREYLLENPKVLMEAIGVLEERRAAEAVEQELLILSQYSDQIYNDGYSYVGGNPEGDVTMVEFLDYRCGFCKRAFPMVKELVETDGNIRFVIKEFPLLGDASTLASRYAIATKILEGEEAYIALHDKLMVWNGDINEAALARLSGDLDIDHEAVLARMNDDDITAIIAQNREIATMLQIQGTPTFLIGETFIRGLAEIEQMRNIVELVREEQS
ncbi:MAG: DsbA family protein [Rhodobacteraceae bacterium]|nr:MAG: DsbA family protein [Paracoccaceae bacterium]